MECSGREGEGDGRVTNTACDDDDPCDEMASERMELVRDLGGYFSWFRNGEEPKESITVYVFGEFISQNHVHQLAEVCDR